MKANLNGAESVGLIIVQWPQARKWRQKVAATAPTAVATSTETSKDTNIINMYKHKNKPRCKIHSGACQKFQSGSEACRIVDLLLLGKPPKNMVQFRLPV